MHFGFSLCSSRLDFGVSTDGTSFKKVVRSSMSLFTNEIRLRILQPSSHIYLDVIHVRSVLTNTTGAKFGMHYKEEHKTCSRGLAATE